MYSSIFTAVTAAALLAIPASAQTNQTYIQGLVNVLNGQNLTSLVGALTAISNTTDGLTIFSKLSSGRPYTLLAPNNDAFVGVNPYFGNDPVWLGQALKYHVIPGSVNVSSIETAPNSTIYPTALDDSAVVHLFPNQTQNIALQKISGTQVVQVSNQNTPCVVVNSTSYQNLNIQILSAVIDLPPNVGSVLALSTVQEQPELTTLVEYAGKVPGFISELESSPSVTFFAPINQAFVDAFASGHLTNSTTPEQLRNIFLNHIINGTIVYTGSPQTNYTSAGGEAITIGTGGLDDGTGSVVYYRGEQVANIVQGNIVTQNGVVHLIDVVLPHDAINPTAALSAVSVASATATPSPQRRRSSRLFANRG